MEIIKKCDKIFFEKILAGKKKFEVRLADFEIKERDVLILKEVVDGKETGRWLKKKAGFILKTKNLPYYEKEEIDKYGYLIIGLED